MKNKFMLDIFRRHKPETEIDEMEQSRNFQCLAACGAPCRCITWH